MIVALYIAALVFAGETRPKGCGDCEIRQNNGNFLVETWSGRPAIDVGSLTMNDLFGFIYEKAIKGVDENPEDGAKCSKWCSQILNTPTIGLS